MLHTTMDPTCAVGTLFNLPLYPTTEITLRILPPELSEHFILALHGIAFVILGNNKAADLRTRLLPSFLASFYIKFIYQVYNNYAYIFFLISSQLSYYSK